MKQFLVVILTFCAYFGFSQQVQWASQLINFSSEWTKDMPENTTRYKATQVLGVPNTMSVKVSGLAWAPKGSTEGKEHITVGFATPQDVQQVIIGETFNAGAVQEIILYDTDGKSYSVYKNKELTYKNNYGETLIPYKVPYTRNVDKLKLILNTKKVGNMQQIDCIGISSGTQPVKLKINELFYSETVSNPENLGPFINSSYYDHLPLISPDNSTLYFARKFIDDDEKDDIYYAKKLPNGKFSKAENIGAPLNTLKNNFVCYISSDNQRLYLANRYRKKGGEGLSLSTKQTNGSWSEPKLIPIPNIGNLNEFAHYHVSLDEKVILMAVQRSDSYGDLDLYVSLKYSDGSWSEPKNLGPIINTVGAEGSVFLAADGRTMYFASTGHQGYGDYDMFVTKRLDNSWTNWSTPLNLGSKINTPEMDIYYTITSDGEYAYFSSGKSYFGLNDLYRMKLPKEAKPEPVFVNELVVNNTPLKTTPTTNSLDDKLAALKNQQQNVPTPTVVNTPTTTNVPVNNNPVATTTTPKPTTTNNDAVADLQQKLEALKNQQQQVKSTPTTTTQPEVVKSNSTLPASVTNHQPTEVIKNNSTLPPSATMEVPKENNYKVDDFKDIPAVENNDYNKKVFDNLNSSPKVKPKTVDPVLNNPTISNTPTTPNNIEVNQVDINQTTPTTNNAPLKTQSYIDPYQQKLDELKKQQEQAKLSTPTSTTTSSYSEYTQPKDYNNPTTPVYNSPNNSTQAQNQKLQDLNQPVQQSTKLPATESYNNPYYQQQNAPLKEKQEDKFGNDYDEMQAKIDALKNQQQQNATSGNKPKKASQIEVDNNNPNIKYAPSTVTTTASVEPSSKINLDKYEDKLKAIQDKMNAIGNTNNQPTSTTLANVESNNTPNQNLPLKQSTTTTDEVQQLSNQLDAIKNQIKENQTPTNIVTTNTPTTNNTISTNEVEAPKLVHNNQVVKEQPTVNPDDLAKQKAQLEALQQEQDKLNNKLNNTLNTLNESKQDLENDINSLQTEKDKINNENKNLNNTNEQLSAEKAQLEAEKKQMDDLLAKMKAEKDKLAAEKEQIEKDKYLLEQLKKQQQSEVNTLSANINKLKQEQADAIKAAQEVKRYEIFDVPIEVGAIAVMSSIYFTADAAFIQTKSYPELDKLVAFLQSHKNIKIEVGGHTNGLCDADFCNKLSGDRANEVMQYLIKKGITADKLTSVGYGKRYLIADAGNPKNQRVEIKILSVDNK
ncbi:MAG: PD40 domain-containing protein [Chitinophagales bacterium]|nr:PD40 domain-containing protein [Chitinophagales bacterium]